MKKCRFCNGSGRDIKVQFYAGEKITKPCKKCHGKGVK